MQLIEALHALQYDATHSLEFEAVLFGVLLATCIPSPHVGGGGDCYATCRPRHATGVCSCCAPAY